jgi:hypothetical protein
MRITEVHGMKNKLEKTLYLLICSKKLKLILLNCIKYSQLDMSLSSKHLMLMILTKMDN